jgi:hypothetical protein
MSPGARLAALVGLVLLGVTGAHAGLAASLSLTSQALTPYSTCVISGPGTTTAVADASVRQGSATSNFGTVTTNNIASQSGSLNRRLYIRFDLTQCSPAIPSTATIRLATLRMFVSALPAACRTVDVFRVNATWTEAAITWNNQPFGTSINNPASGSAVDTFGVGTPVGCENRTANVYTTGGVVTSNVASFVAGTLANFGWMLRDDVEGSTTASSQTYSAKDLATPARAPQLVITYVVVP